MRQLRARGRRTPNGVTVRTTDGVILRGVHLSGGADAPAGPTFVVAHGMTNATGRVSTRAVLDRLSTHGPVVAFDFRGHGRSGGRSSVGRDEILDVDAAVSFARGTPMVPWCWSAARWERRSHCVTRAGCAPIRP